MAVTLESLKKKAGKGKSPLFVWLADLQHKAGKSEDALSTISSGLENFPEDPLARLVRSAIFFDQGNLDAALADCDEILRKDPLCLSALKRKGAIWDAKGETIERNRCYRLLHDLDPLDEFWKEEYADVPQEELPPEDEEAFVLPTEEGTSEDFSLPEEVAPEASAEEDPFAAIASLMPTGEAEPETSSEDALLAASLNSALSGDIQTSEDVQEFTALQDKPVSGDDVSSAISDFFGDALGDEEHFESASASPFALQVPTSLEDDIAEEKTKSASPFTLDVDDEVLSGFEKSAPESVGVIEPVEPVQKDAPTSLDDAFDSIFGDDELPEEGGFTKSAPESAGVIEPVEPVQKDAPTSLDDAFDSIFGDDELPEEKGFEKSAPEALEISEPTFTKSAPESVGVIEPSEPALEVDSPFAVPPPAIDLDEEPKESLSELIGKVELPEADIDLDESPAEESLLNLLGSLEEKPSEKVAEELPEIPSGDLEEGVSNAFNSMFGNDDLSADLSNEISSRVLPEKEPEQGKKVDGLLGDDDDLVIPSKDASKDSSNNDFAGEVSHSLNALFGDDDDLEMPVPSIDKASDKNPEDKKGVFETLFDQDDDVKLEPIQGQDKVDVLISGDADDEISAALLKNPSATLSDNNEVIDENLNTRTLAEIYFDQGLFQKSLEIYRDLALKSPEDKQIIERLAEVERACEEKFGKGNA